MIPQTRPSTPAAKGPGALLRYWRQQRGKSQLDLSLDSGVSQRHLSFMESGRSLPSRGMLLTLSAILDIPLREQNALLLASGHAPVYLESNWDAPAMASVTWAVDRMLAMHEPHPALVMDRYWNVLKTNQAAPAFFGTFIDLSRYASPRNLLHLMLDPQAMRPFIADWEQVAAALLQRVHREAVGHSLDEKTADLLDQLRQYPGVKALKPPQKTQTPVLAVTFQKDGHRTSWFSMISTIGLPQDVTAQEFRIECMFPADGDFTEKP